jgi:hypothetical protein
VAVNPISNRIFVVSAGSSNLVVIDGATDKAVSGAQVGFNSTAVVVNPVTNKIYVANSEIAQTVTAIDGVSYMDTTVALGNTPGAMVVNPIINKIYVDNGGNLVTLTEQQVQPIPLLTKITPLIGNQTSSRAPSFNFQTISTYEPVTPPPLAVYFQVDTWQGSWTKAGGSNPAFSGQTGTLLLGTHVLYAYASDGQDASINNNTLNGQAAIGEIAAYPFTVMQVSSATVLTSDVNPSVPGGTVTLTATVSAIAPGTGTPTGAVTFFDGTTALGSSAPNSSGIATFATSTLTAGTHSLTAQYAGDMNFVASTSPVLSQVVQIVLSTTITALSPLSSASYGAPVTFAATVTSTSSGTPTGAITFLDGTIALGVGTLNGGARATFRISTLTVGTHSITAAYGGDSNFTASNSPAVTETITPAATTAVLVSSGVSASSGAPVTFTATITSSSPGTPSGTLTFLDGTTALGTGTLNGSGVATLTTSTLTVGTHSITANYSGSGNFASSTSPVFTETITPAAAAATTATIVASAASASSGNPLTFTATITSSGSGTPTGSITFLDGTATLGTGTLNSNAVATLMTSTLTVGTHSIICRYAGNANFASSTSTAVMETITPAVTAPTTVALVSSSISASSDSPVTFTATVTSSTSGMPTGIVTFLDGTASLGTRALTSGAVATFTTSTLTVGTHSITAAYSGDSKFATSTSTALSQVVLAPSFTIAGSPASVTVSAGNSATYQIVVSGKNNFSGTVTLSCNAGLPSGTSCSSLSASITPSNSSVTSTLAINTTARSTALLLPFFGDRSAPLFAGWMLIPAIVLGLLGLSAQKRKLRLGYPLALVLVGCVLWQTGCASSGSTPMNKTTGTPAGSYAVTVMATSGAAQQTVSLTLVVQ